MSLSVVMIVRNGVTPPADIVRAIRSVADIADEIVVVDTGSTDWTVAVLRQLQAEMPGKLRVFRRRWRFDFAEARNYSITKANGDWILWLDADEEVPPESRAKIREIVDRDDRGESYIFYLSGPRIPGLIPQLRLFPNRSDVYFVRPVHEQVVPALERAGIRVEVREDVLIKHHGYEDEGKLIESMRRNIEIAYIYAHKT